MKHMRIDSFENIKIFFENVILHKIAVAVLDYAITPSFSFL